MKWLFKVINKALKIGSAKVQPKEQVMLMPADLKTYIAEHVDKRFEGSKEQLFDNIHTIKSLLDDLANQLADLADRPLQNEKIPERAVAVMDGNRKTYIARHKPLVDMKIPSDTQFEKVVKFINDVEKELELLKTSTGKSHAILAQFFGNELSAMNQTLKQIEESNAHLRDACQAEPDKLQDLQKAQKDVEEFLYSIKTQEVLRKRLEELDVSKQNALDEKERAKTKIESFKKDPDFSTVAEFESQRSEIDNQIVRLQDELRQRLLPLDKPLRKYVYEKKEGYQLIENYLDSPLKTLAQDGHHKLVQVLQTVRGMLEALDLKDRLKEKAEEVIDSLDSHYLRHISEQYAQLSSKKIEVEKKLRLSHIMRNYDELMYRVKHIDQKIERFDAEVQEASKKLERIDLEKSRTRLEQTLSDTLDAEVSIHM